MILSSAGSDYERLGVLWSVQKTGLSIHEWLLVAAYQEPGGQLARGALKPLYVESDRSDFGLYEKAQAL